MKAFVMFALVAAITVAGVAYAGVVDEALADYQKSGGGNFSAQAGKTGWDKPGKDNLSCASCHTNDLRTQGKHKETAEVIDPLAPSANPKRLTDRKFIEKWFKRNCNTVYGRECTPQEKGDFLMYIKGE